MSAFVDTTITAFAYGKGGFHESNFTLAPIAKRWGIVPAMTVKSAEHVAISWFILSKAKDHDKLAMWSAIGLMVAQTYVDYRNIKTLNANKNH